MIKNILAVLFGVILIGLTIYSVNIEKEPEQEEPEQEQSEEEQEEESSSDDDLTDLVSCLEEENVVIYGTSTCPHCLAVVESFGGYDVINPIYANCSEGDERCETDKQTRYVPEIQINGELYEGERSPEAVALKVNCEL
jgi:glutaredoxin